MKEEYWVVKNAVGAKMLMDANPWGDGACFVNALPVAFTVFLSEDEAQEAYDLSVKYVEMQGIDSSGVKNLYKYWEMDKWTIVRLFDE